VLVELTQVDVGTDREEGMSVWDVSYLPVGSASIPYLQTLLVWSVVKQNK